jgi:hypothetical protein
MKTRNLFIFSALVVLASCNEKHDRNNKGGNNWVEKVVNKEIGPIQHKEFNGDFDEIQVSQAIEAEIIKSETEKVEISAPQNIINEILVENDGGKLHIHYKPGIRVMNIHKVTAKIYAKDFKKLVADSAAKIDVKDKFTQEKQILKHRVQEVFPEILKRMIWILISAAAVISVVKYLGGEPGCGIFIRIIT